MAKSAPLTPLFTRWGRDIDPRCPLGEYPRPQLMRDEWDCLNGLWQYAIVDGHGATPPLQWQGEILVPFSPESLLSGVGRQLASGQTLWYRRTAVFQTQKERTVLLHFGAVDQCCTVYLNGQAVGSHAGGYWPFSLDITAHIHTGENELVVAVTDALDTGIHAYGKQKLDRGGIWYTAQSGIWQTVWMEYLPENYISHLKIVPDYDAGSVRLSLSFSKGAQPGTLRILSQDGDIVHQADFNQGDIVAELGDFHAWHPESPYLYGVEITAGADSIRSYFGMRKFSLEKNAEGFPVIVLNNEPLFQSGLLDQGYWSDGMYTPPSDEAMVWELTEIKKLGFNMLRKHIKIEPLRWYYHCDRLGILVWQDFVSGGAPYNRLVTQVLPFVGIHLRDDKYRIFGRQNAEGRRQFTEDMQRTVDLLFNTVGLAVWVPFNEGWGQFDAAEITRRLRTLDPTRLIDSASGYHDQQVGDFLSPHIYYRAFRPKTDRQGRALVLSEFGGYSRPSPGHMSSEKLFGYKMYPDKEAVTQAFCRLYRDEVLPARKQGLCAAVYTQVSDVEDEINGLFTYDRELVKLDAEAVAAVNRELTGGSENK